MVTGEPVAALVTGVVVPAAATASVMSCRRLQDHNQGAGSEPRSNRLEAGASGWPARPAAIAQKQPGSSHLADEGQTATSTSSPKTAIVVLAIAL
jgi:hypothetical protein